MLVMTILMMTVTPDRGFDIFPGPNFFGLVPLVLELGSGQEQPTDSHFLRPSFFANKNGPVKKNFFQLFAEN